MFSQLRNAVEQLAQPIREAASQEEHSDPPARSGSLDIHAARSTSPLSSNDLAESALATLRKSLVSQRSNTTPSPKPSASATPAENARPRKSNLEERLRRAAFAIGDASGSTTPGTTNRSSRVGSPSPMNSDRNSMPPKVQESVAHKTPLPSSPVVIATLDENKLEQPPKLALQEMPSSETESAKGQAPSQTLGDSPPIPQTTSPTEVYEEKKDTSSEAGKQPQEDSTASVGDVNPVITQAEVAPAAVTPPSASPDPSAETELGTLEAEVASISNDDAEPLAETMTTVSVEGTSVEEESLLVEEKEATLTNEAEPSPLDEAGKEIIQPVEIQETPIVQASPEHTPSPFDKIPPVPEVITETPQETTESPRKEQSPALQTPPIVDHTAELEALQARLKQVEQRFSDVSTSFKRLQAEKLAADAVLRETTPLESIKDADGLREFLTQVKSKDKLLQDEISLLNKKLELQNGRIEEIHDTHRLESQSRSAEVDKLKKQIDETEALFQAAQRATTKAEETSDKYKADIAQLEVAVEKAKSTAKEEEEKRVKAISLLKTVRQKLVKAEKDKDDAMRELAASKEREQGDKNKEQADRQNFQREIEALTASHEQAIASIKSQFNKDFSNMQERYKQEIGALRGQSELDMATAKSSYTKELSAKSSQISTLENSLNNITRDKNVLFDQLQLRQAELESAQAHLESVEHQNTEFQFQLREANDRVALLKEECSELLREQETRSRDVGPSAEEVARMVSATEVKYESKIAELKRNLGIMEKERHDSESDWSRKLKEKVKELEDLKRILGSATKSREADENVVANLRAELALAQQTAKNFERQISELPLLRDQVSELEKTLREQEKDSSVKLALLDKQLEELKAREAQVKQSNKVLREELRKVQSSAALLERQRNPGVGYWTTRDNGSAAEPRTSNVSQPDTPARVASPAPSTAASSKNEEEVNLEYLRNVILQFLEHKEMRPNLVKVLSIILHFTPQETRRLIAKV